MRLGIDAANFVADRRGMGRVARGIAAAALDEPTMQTTFLLGGANADRALRELFPGHDIAIAATATARRPGRFDVVWFPWNGMRFGARARSVVTVHDAFAFTDPARGVIARFREQQPMRRAARAAARIVSPSEWSRAEIVRALRIEPSRVTVIPNAPNAWFSPGQETTDALHGRNAVLLVGVRERRKNARVVIDACVTAFSSSADTLVIVGDLHRDDERRIALLGVPHLRISAADDALLRSLYRGARVVAVPSTAEGFGLVAAEAMACGTATIAADVGGLRESTRGGALLLPADDVRAWRDAIDRVLHDEGFAEALAVRGAAEFAHADSMAPANAYLRLFAALAT